ncbi:TonB-dependent receptor plug domain-containing protein [Flavobacterium phragmitis]|uniref:TonB-dependent outer membrane receptor, SusC/RagA subfamily, signature region n=1 Tax=Flavobacterium phragmitis TaxID=739143 RepID=A0A1I1MEG9_9FLAO|nr:TonB-dependent receptor plug domain-containing protein [Flavobacterium phragmitis]SFC83861.1 TonB-dependent outer membrane receptor, SusC/RagA subfamily, signature region [Flavobacterium phragmitis]
MKNIKYIVLFVLFQTTWAQKTEKDWNTAYKKSVTEKVYLQLNNVLYTPNETVYFTGFITEADNSPSGLSEYLYVDLLDGSNKKIVSQCYVIENGSAAGSYKIPETAVSGMYKIRAYTRIQNQTLENIFEKTFFVQKVVAPRILMTLDFKKKAYGRGEVCEADFDLKNLENQPIKNYDFTYDIFISGKKIDSFKGKTDDLGKAVVRFKLPADLTSNDGILNVMLDYDNFKESVTRSIPINLNFIDLQFLPESGNLVANESSSLFFIAKNEFGLPMDVAGFIEDEKGTKISEFKSIHDGMGNLILKSMENKQYYAVVTSPFQSAEKIALPKAEKNLFVVNTQKNPQNVVVNIYAPVAMQSKMLVRNTAKIYKTIDVSLKLGWNSITVETKDFPVGIQSFSLMVEDQIVAERLVFLNYQDGLKIEIKTDKDTYLPREKVKVSVITKDKNNLPIASNLSVSVVDSKLLTYIDDKQDNILSWMLLGFELKGKIHEPRFYFDENKKNEEREEAIDLLLNTHGWRKFNQKNLQKLLLETNKIEPEKNNSIEGFILNDKGKPATLKVFLFTDKGKAFETKSNSSGYFQFSKVHFTDLAYLIVDGKKNRRYVMKNSISNAQEFLKMKDTLSNNVTSDINYDYKETAESFKKEVNVTGNSVSLDSDNQSLNEVVVVGYGMQKKKDITGSVMTISAQEIYSTALNGRVTGLQITSSTGQTGSADKVLIRGLSSVYGSRSGGQPLIVIDGVPYVNNENSSIFGSFPAASIQSVTVLKDASATALYGSNGAYGVILVTTKNKIYRSKIIVGKRHHYTFQNINRSEVKNINEAEGFYVPKYGTTITEKKTDFRSCIYWNSVVQTNNKGEAVFEFYTSDDNTSFKILAEGTSYKGDLGKSETAFAVKELIQSDVKVPIYASNEDVIMLPIWLKNNTNLGLNLQCGVSFNKRKINFSEENLFLKPNESKTIYVSFTASETGKKLPLEINLIGDNYKTQIRKEIDVYTKGFPANVDVSGMNSQKKDFFISDPIPGSIETGFKLFYNPFSSIFDGLESMMREPYGCFEQVSSSNYPNIMAMQLMKFKSISPEFKKRAMQYLENGYQKLKNYESKDGGFEWYGGNPGNEALTVYGLLQFNEMKEFINVDQKLIERSMKWIDSRKDDKGGFKQNPGRYGFSGIRYEVNNAYIVYVLSEIGNGNIEQQYDAALKEALKSNDLYRMNLMALASYNLNKINQYKELMVLIKNEIKKNGFENLKAQQSVIHSYGKSMNMEIVSLYGLALLKEKQLTKEVSDVLDYIQSAKTVYGFGSTQATALALKCITEYAKISMGVTSVLSEDLVMSLNNELVALSSKDKNGNVILKDLKVNSGNNSFSIQIPEQSPIPYLLYVQYQSYKPNNSKDCKLVLKSKTLKTEIKTSETARVEVEVQNTSFSEVSNPIARIGIPGGLTPEPWQLKELIDKNIVDYYEIFGSELVFYFRKLNAKEIRKVNIDFKAVVPGNYKGIASSAYLYYENEHRNWNSGLEIEVLP